MPTVWIQWDREGTAAPTETINSDKQKHPHLTFACILF